MHTLPVAMVADLLRWRGFDVAELGAHTPASALAEVAGQTDRLVAIGIASTTSGLDAEVALSLRATKAAAPETPSFLGGNAILLRGARTEVGSRRLDRPGWTECH